MQIIFSDKIPQTDALIQLCERAEFELQTYNFTLEVPGGYAQLVAFVTPDPKSDKLLIDFAMQMCGDNNQRTFLGCNQRGEARPLPDVLEELHGNQTYTFLAGIIRRAGRLTQLGAGARLPV